LPSSGRFSCTSTISSGPSRCSWTCSTT
jgi:hypothetical protein